MKHIIDNMLLTDQGTEDVIEAAMQLWANGAPQSDALVESTLDIQDRGLSMMAAARLAVSIS